MDHAVAVPRCLPLSGIGLDARRNATAGVFKAGNDGGWVVKI